MKTFVASNTRGYEDLCGQVIEMSVTAESSVGDVETMSPNRTAIDGSLLRRILFALNQLSGFIKEMHIRFGDPRVRFVWVLGFS